MSFPYFSPELDRSAVGVEALADRVELVDTLQSQLLMSEIDKGNVTLAMIRPSLEGATVTDGTDDELAAQLEAEVVGLGVMAKFSVVFDQDAITAFYNESREKQLNIPPERTGFDNRWDEFSGLMMSGPTTVLLLYSNRGDAVETWRDQIGHWNIESNRDPDTIRGRLGIDNYNNLVHGSDSIDSVRRETGIIADLLSRHSRVN